MCAGRGESLATKTDRSNSGSSRRTARCPATMPISLRSSLRVIIATSTVGQCAEALGLDGRAAGRVNGKLTAWELLASDGANLNVRLDQLRDAARHLDEANPVVQRLASSPEVARCSPTDGCLACPSQVGLVWVAPEHGRRSQQGPYVATGVPGRSSSSTPGYRPGRVRHRPLPARPTYGPGRRSSSAAPYPRRRRPSSRPSWSAAAEQSYQPNSSTSPSGAAGAVHRGSDPGSSHPPWSRRCRPRSKSHSLVAEWISAYAAASL